MDQIVLLTLSLCWWTTTARYVWSDKPGILVDYEISEGETAQIICLLPIAYSGGLCRLFRGDARTPFKVMTATTYSCTFNLTSKEVLGESMVGSTIRLRCDYRLQDYTSVFSDTKPVTVWGTRPSPHLSINRRLFSTEDIIEVTCAGGERESPSSCTFYNPYIIAEGPCSRNITFKNLIKYIKPSVLHLVNLTCTYDPDEFLAIRSEYSNQQPLIVVDTSLVTGTSSVDCLVSMSDDQLEAFRERTWRSSAADGTTITVQMTNSSLNIQTTCTESLNKTKVI